jgi:hypothetical protein
LDIEMQRTTAFAATLALGLLVAACSSGPDPKSFGGQLQTQGGNVSAIGENGQKVMLPLPKAAP